MAAEFTFDNKDANEMLKKLASRFKQIDDGHGEFVGILSTVVYRDIMEHFKDEEGSEGPWKPWSKVYQKHMEKVGRAGNKKLQYSGRLRMGVQPQNVRKAPGGFMWFDNAKTSKGFPYAEAHDEGGKQLPKRDFMWLSDKAMESLSNQLIRFANDGES